MNSSKGQDYFVENSVWVLRNFQDQAHTRDANASMFLTLFFSISLLWMRRGKNSTIQQGNLIIILHDNLSQQQMMYSLWQH